MMTTYNLNTLPEQRLGGLTASQSNGRKCLSTPSSPSKTTESTRTTPQPTRNRCRSGSIGFGTGVGDLNAPVGIAVTTVTTKHSNTRGSATVVEPPPNYSAVIISSCDERASLT